MEKFSLGKTSTGRDLIKLTTGKIIIKDFQVTYREILCNCTLNSYPQNAQSLNNNVNLSFTCKLLEIYSLNYRITSNVS